MNKLFPRSLVSDPLLSPYLRRHTATVIINLGQSTPSFNPFCEVSFLENATNTSPSFPSASAPDFLSCYSYASLSAFQVLSDRSPVVFDTGDPEVDMIQV